MKDTYVKRSYRKLNKSYWYGEHYAWKYIILAFMALFTIWALISFWNNQNPLVSPVVINPVKQVYAEESIKIPCEVGVAEFLECEAVKGNITYKQAEIMLAIAKAESNLKERAANRHSSARGVFQIISGTWYNYDCVGDKYAWKDNTICALKIMHRSGFTPWEVYNTGSYLRYL